MLISEDMAGVTNKEDIQDTIMFFKKDSHFLYRPGMASEQLKRAKAALEITAVKVEADERLQPKAEGLRKALSRLQANPGANLAYSRPEELEDAAALQDISIQWANLFTEEAMLQSRCTRVFKEKMLRFWEQLGLRWVICVHEFFSGLHGGFWMC